MIAINSVAYWPRRLTNEERAIITSWHYLRDKKPGQGEDIEFRVIFPDCTFDTSHGTYIPGNQVAIPGCAVSDCNLHLDPVYTWWRPRIATREADIVRVDEANWWSQIDA